VSFVPSHGLTTAGAFFLSTPIFTIYLLHLASIRAAV
jgi:hypothetical protein